MKKIVVSPRVKRKPLKPVDANRIVNSQLASCNDDIRSESTEEASEGEYSFRNKTNFSAGKENVPPRSKKIRKIVDKLSPLFEKGSNAKRLVNKTSPAKDKVTSRRSIFGEVTNKNNQSIIKNEEFPSFVINDWLDFKQLDFDQF